MAAVELARRLREWRASGEEIHRISNDRVQAKYAVFTCARPVDVTVAMAQSVEAPRSRRAVASRRAEEKRRDDRFTGTSAPLILQSRPRARAETPDEDGAAYEVIDEDADPEAGKAEADDERQDDRDRQPHHEPVPDRQEHHEPRVPRPAQRAPHDEVDRLRRLTQTDHAQRP